MNNLNNIINNSLKVNNVLLDKEMFNYKPNFELPQINIEPDFQLIPTNILESLSYQQDILNEFKERMEELERKLNIPNIELNAYKTLDSTIKIELPKSFTNNDFARYQSLNYIDELYDLETNIKNDELNKSSNIEKLNEMCREINAYLINLNKKPIDKMKEYSIDQVFFTVGFVVQALLFIQDFAGLYNFLSDILEIIKRYYP